MAVSEHVRSRLTDAGIPRNRVTVVYDGVDPGPAPSRQLLADPRPIGSLKIVTPATSDPLKCVGLLREVEQRSRIRSIRSSDLENDLADADLFVYLSASEGLGSAILLAMARGVPVIASNVGGIRELIEHEATGLLVENDTEDVSAAMERFAANPALATRCAENARRQVEERFSEDRMVRRTELVYRAVLGGEKPA
jgi:glycosyltransferase involved in cell wall biosynthesis